MLEFNLILGCKMSLSMLLFILKTSGKDWSQSWFKQSVFHCGDHWNVIFFGIYKIYICESGFSRSELEQFTGSVSFKLFIELLGYFSFQFRVLPLRKYLQTRQCKVYVVCYGILHCWRSHQQSCFQIVSFCWEGHPGFLFGHDTCIVHCDHSPTWHLPEINGAPGGGRSFPLLFSLQHWGLVLYSETYCKMSRSPTLVGRKNNHVLKAQSWEPASWSQFC